MTICINLLAIKLNSSRGFSFAAALQLFFIAITSFYEKLPFNEDAFYVPILIIINPISHLILGWHSSSINNVDNLIDSLGIQFDLNLSLVVLLLSNLALLYVGMKVVDKQELIITNAETGGN
jgi:hypothetical protein